MLLNGRAIAKEILDETAQRVALLGRPVRLGILSIAPDAVTEQYLSVKQKRASEAGIEVVIERFAADAAEHRLHDSVDRLAIETDAVVVQLPVPTGVDTLALCERIPLNRDADVLSSAAYDSFIAGPGLVPPVASAVSELLARVPVTPMGLRAAVVGNGKLVGAPVAAWLSREGASVAVYTLETGLAEDCLREADIVVSGAGVAGLIGADMLSSTAVVIDAGTSEQGGVVVGDVDPRAEASVRAFSPVPGGVGPVAVACLLRNAVALAERRGQ